MISNKKTEYFLVTWKAWLQPICCIISRKEKKEHTFYGNYTAQPVLVIASS